MQNTQLRAAVIGASGYAGLELIRLITHHPVLQLTYVAGNHSDEDILSEVYPFLAGAPKLRVVKYDGAECRESCDVAFVALPSGSSGQIAADLYERGVTVIDLSGDLRLDEEDYAKWYRHEPVRHAVRQKAVYGLTEWMRDGLSGARLVANPGCYATAVLLALLPIADASFVNLAETVLVDAKSGVSGAGRAAALSRQLGELDDNFYAYKVSSHQHIPEIEQCLAQFHGPSLGAVHLTTQLLPITRGIFASIYVRLAHGSTDAHVYEHLMNRYRDEKFITVHRPGVFPELKHVRGSNRCHIGYRVDERTGWLQLFSVLDNLQKGAAGQALQNANVMFGLDEHLGLAGMPLYA